MKPIVILCLFVALFASCKSSTSPNGGAAAPAGVGSTFTFRHWSVDSTGAIRDTGTIAFQVLATGTSYYGKTNVSKILLSAGDSSIGYMNYESNGDISFFNDNHGTWSTVPIASKGSITSVIFDSIEGGSRQKSTDTYTYVGSETVTVPAGTFDAIKVEYVNTYSTDSYTESEQPQYGWFSSQLGMMYVKLFTAAYISGGYKVGEEHIELASYMLK